MRVFIGKSYVYLGVGVILGIVFCFILPSLHYHENATTPAKTLAYTHLRALSPASWDENLKTTQELVPFKTVIEDKINEYKKDKKADVVAYYFRDLNNGPWFGVNEDHKFRIASLFKVPTLLSYYHWAEIDPRILQEKLTYNGEESHNSDANKLTKPEQRLQEGKQYTVNELLKRMIIYSDNEAFKMLIEHADVGLIADPYNIVEMQIESVDSDFLASTQEFAPFFRVLYNASYLTPEYSEKAIKLLIQTEFKNGLTAGIPKNIEVAHKFGIRETQDGIKQLHDCGIIYHKDFPYVLCVMTSGDSTEELISIIAELSKLTYEKVHSQIVQ